MASIIIASNGASSAQIDRAVESARSVEGAETYLLADKAAPNLGSTVFVSTKNTSMATAIRGAIDGSQQKLFILLDARLNISGSELANFARFAAERSADTVSYVSLESENDTIDFGDPTVDSIVPIIASRAALPSMCTAFGAEAAELCIASQAQSSAEYACEIAMRSVANHSSLARYTNSLACPVSSDDMVLQSSAAARVLTSVINHTNIEELFPNHPWQAFQAESAAASYHALAALFIRMGEFDPANECLKLSDQFEDSPRSLALKAIIARDKGEMLGAVANMVSSLQQYEIRKKNEEGRHYLTFLPSDLEVINKSLQDGLAALNQRDNKSALSHFSHAVFNFDPFYRDSGIEH